MNRLQIRNLSFAYDSRLVLSKINFSARQGEFIALIGPNGAGKSTLIKLLAGILRAGTETIHINDKPISAIPRRELARLVAYVPQETEFIFDYYVEEVVRMGRFPYSSGFGISTPSDEEIVRQVMEIMDITGFRGRRIRELSGGEKQRVIVASALAQQPQILMLDEPTSAMDLHHQIAIYRILQQQQLNHELLVIVVTHDINLAAQFCRRMILLHQGAIIADGKPEDVLQFGQIQDTFGVKVYIDINPLTKSLYILPYA